MQTSDQDVILQGARISNYMPYIEEDLAKVENGIRAEALSKALKHTLSEAEALRFWQEIAVVERLRRLWRTRTSLAVSLASQNETSLALLKENGD